jgi:SAM-dependent methyltransferase
MANPYAECIRTFIQSHGIKSVVDVGCGDFRVGRKLIDSSIDYTGIDVVDALVKANQERFGASNVRFRCLDIVRDDLPPGDLCLVREVLQHLSNLQIQKILEKLKQYKWVIITETLPGPVGSFKANLDKPHGRDARCVWHSGLVLTEPPFSLPAVQTLLEIPSVRAERGSDERIASFLLCH